VLVSSDQDGKVFSWGKDSGVPKADLVGGEQHTCNVTLLANFGDTLFSASVDGSIKKAHKSGDSSFEFKHSVKITGAPIAISAANEKVLFVLNNNSKISAIDNETFTIIKEVEVKDYEATALAATHTELWVGDKKGLIHILGEDLVQKAVIEKKHNHAISAMTSSRDGTLIASGDAYRYIYVFNAETKEETACFPYHASKVIGLDFNPTNTLLLTSGLDLTVGVANLAD
jgi:WD40 repeat protein